MKSTASDTRKPYRGISRALVLALDVGTTFSGVSYALLEPGEVPKIHGVTRFPGQEHVAGNSKIPTILWYDKEGELKCAGAEAERENIIAQADEEDWLKAELFKLRLRPKTMRLNMNGMAFSPLPKGKSAVDVFGDFLSYLYRCTRSFFEDTHANGPKLWKDLEREIQFVLSHPNGWEGAQQTKMRRAAARGGLIPDTDSGKARIRFVTEGEASLHACVLNGLAADVLSNPSSHGFVVADAGGGTLDISSYAIRTTAPLIIEEIAPPDCIFAGSVFVSRRAKAFLKDRLRDSKYGEPDSIDHITRRFDETTKRLFRDAGEPQFVAFGSPLDKDPSAGIKSGQLKLTGNEVADFFEPSIQAAMAAIHNQIEASNGFVKSVWLVGGFAASPWLFSQLSDRLSALGVSVSRPDTQTSKAVADGAVGFYCDHHVSARMSKFMYGVEYLREFDGADPDHVARKDRLCELPSGPKLLLDAFDCILSRNVKVKESTVFSRKYCTELTSLSTLSVFEVEIWCYRGGDIVPKWIIRDAEAFSTLCLVRADLSPLTASAQPKTGRGGKKFWTIVFSIEIHFGLTEFRARIKWVDTEGKTKYGPASIIYNESGTRAQEEEPEYYPEDDTRSSAVSRAPSTRVSRASSRTRDHPAMSSASRSIPASEPPSARTSMAPSMAPSVAPSVSPSVAPSAVPSRAPSVVERRGSSRSSNSSLYTNRGPATTSREIPASQAPSQVPSRAPSVAPSIAESTMVGGVALDIAPAQPSRRTSTSSSARPPHSRRESTRTESMARSDRPQLRESPRSPDDWKFGGVDQSMSRSTSHSSTIADHLGAVWGPGSQPQTPTDGYFPRAGSMHGSRHGSTPREGSKLATPAVTSPRHEAPPSVSSRAPSSYHQTPRAPSPGTASHRSRATTAHSRGMSGHMTPRPVTYDDDDIVIPPMPEEEYPSRPPSQHIESPADVVVPPPGSAYGEEGGWGGAPGGFQDEYMGSEHPHSEFMSTPSVHEDAHESVHGDPNGEERSLDDILAGVGPTAPAGQSLFGSNWGGGSGPGSTYLSDVLSPGGGATPAHQTPQNGGWFSGVGNFLSTPALGKAPSIMSKASSAVSSQMGSRLTSRAPSHASSRAPTPAEPSPPAPKSSHSRAQSTRAGSILPSPKSASRSLAPESAHLEPSLSHATPKAASTILPPEPEAPPALAVNTNIAATPATTAPATPAVATPSTVAARKVKKGKKGSALATPITPAPVEEYRAPTPPPPVPEEPVHVEVQPPSVEAEHVDLPPATDPLHVDPPPVVEAPPPPPEPATPVAEQDDWFGGATVKQKKGKKGKKAAADLFADESVPQTPAVEKPPSRAPSPKPPSRAPSPQPELRAPSPRPATPQPEPVVADEQPGEDDWFSSAPVKGKKGKKGKNVTPKVTAPPPEPEPAPIADVLQDEPAIERALTPEPEPAAAPPAVDTLFASPEPTEPVISPTAEADDWFAPTPAKKGKKGKKASPWGAADDEPEPPTPVALENLGPPASVKTPSVAPSKAPSAAVSKAPSMAPSKAPSAMVSPTADATGGGFFSSISKIGETAVKKSGWGGFGGWGGGEEKPPTTVSAAQTVVTPAAEAGEDDWFAPAKGKKGKQASTVGTPAPLTPAESKAGGDDWFASAKSRNEQKETMAGGWGFEEGSNAEDPSHPPAEELAPAVAEELAAETTDAPAAETLAAPETEPEAATAEDDDWFSGPAKKAKKGKKGKAAEEPTPDPTPADTPVIPGEEPKKEEKAEEDWGVPVATKKKKKGKR